jgi:N-methylhydantoinase A
MIKEASGALRHDDGAERQIHLDLRYVGQEFTLQVAVSLQQIESADRGGIRRAFDALYEQRYAHHSAEEPVEMVNVRLAAIGKRQQLVFPRLSEAGPSSPSQQRDVYFSDTRKPVPCPVYQRAHLSAASRIRGPALIQEHGTTTVLFERDLCTVAPSGELLITVGAT